MSVGRRAARGNVGKVRGVPRELWLAMLPEFHVANGLVGGDRDEQRVA